MCHKMPQARISPMCACVAAGQVAGTSVPAQYAAAAAIVPRTGSVVVGAVLLTVTAALALAVLPLEAVALTISTCGPLASVLVFSWPESPLYTEGVCSVHSRAPSINSSFHEKLHNN